MTDDYLDTCSMVASSIQMGPQVRTSGNDRVEQLPELALQLQPVEFEVTQHQTPLCVIEACLADL